MTTLVLYLLILFLAIALGAGLYEHRIVLPQWFSRGPEGTVWNAQAAREADVGRKFWGMVSTGPLTLLLLVNGFLAWTAEPSAFRSAWILALVVILVERALTFGYFIPAMVRLMKGALDDARATALARQWSALNGFRHLLNLLAFLAALRAFALFYAV